MNIVNDTVNLQSASTERLDCKQVAQFSLTGPLNIDALAAALSEIVRRHAPLTAYFLEDDSASTSVPSVRLSSQDIVDLSDQPVSEQDQYIKQVSFDLTKGALMQTQLLKCAEGRHVLLVGLRHTRFDPWLIDGFQQEITSLYNAFLAQQSLALTGSTGQTSGAYSSSQPVSDQASAHASRQESLDFWSAQLAGELPQLELPIDRTREPQQLYGSATCTLELPQTLRYGLEALSQRNGTTLFATLLSAFNVLLYRHTGQTDLIVGSPVSKALCLAVEQPTVILLNFLALRTSLDADMTFQALLSRVCHTVQEVYSHRYVPLETLIKELKTEKMQGISPVFQSRFQLSESFSPANDSGALHIEGHSAERDSMGVDLSLEIVDDGTQLVCEFEYKTPLFENATIVRLATHFQQLLQGIIDNPERPISQLPLLTEPERQQLLTEWNKVPAEYPADDTCIHQQFEVQVERTPDAVAVTFGDQQLSYWELNCRANQLAHYLRSVGVEAETLVGLCVERSLDMIVGLLGILKAGGAYVPLDPNYPSDRLSFTVNDAGIQVLLTQESLLSRISADVAHTFCFDRDQSHLLQQSQDNPAVAIASENLAYVIYTSGSTGKPKGVLISHSNVMSLFSATQPYYNFSSSDVWTLFHSFAFDFSVWEIWGALLYGGTLVVVPYLISRSPEEFYTLLSKHQVTVLNQTPSAFNALIRAETYSDRSEPLALRLVIFGGEALNPESLQPWFERHGDQKPQLVNMYGITETTVHVTYHPLSLADSGEKSSIVGRPIPSLQAYILDENRQPVPIGVTGELYISGAGLARGYLNRSDLTSARFVDHRFTEDSASVRLYRSGDLARYCSDGRIEYLGRIDHQVKIRGFRIELGEIETALAQHPQVKQWSVIAREDEPGDKRLVAYGVASNEEWPTASELRLFLQQSLPDYMVPSAFVRLEDLPLTPNGKVDRRTLPQPDSADMPSFTTYIAPQTALQQQLADVWGEILQLEQVGIHDNFFEIGGHSILATQVTVRLRTLLQVNLPLRVLFEQPTITQLAQHIERLMWFSQSNSDDGSTATDGDLEEFEL